MQALQTGLWSKSGPLATRARNPWRGHLQNRHGREYPISDQRGKVLSFGPFELSIGNMLLANGAKRSASRRSGPPQVWYSEGENKGTRALIVGGSDLVVFRIRTNFGN